MVSYQKKQRNIIIKICRFWTGSLGSCRNCHYWMHLAYGLCSSCQTHGCLLTGWPWFRTPGHLPRIIRVAGLGMSCRNLSRSPLRVGSRSLHRLTRQIGLLGVDFIVFLIFGFNEDDSSWMRADYFVSDSPPVGGTTYQSLQSWDHLHYEPSSRSTSSPLFISDANVNILEMKPHLSMILLMVQVWNLSQSKEVLSCFPSL